MYEKQTKMKKKSTLMCKRKYVQLSKLNSSLDLTRKSQIDASKVNVNVQFRKKTCQIDSPSNHGF